MIGIVDLQRDQLLETRAELALLETYKVTGPKLWDLLAVQEKTPEQLAAMTNEWREKRDVLSQDTNAYLLKISTDWDTEKKIVQQDLHRRFHLYLNQLDVVSALIPMLIARVGVARSSGQGRTPERRAAERN